MIACTHAHAAAVARLEAPAIRRSMRLHLTSASCEQRRGAPVRWTIETRERVTLTIVVTEHDGRIRVAIVGGVA